MQDTILMWNEKAETMDRKELKVLQLQKLQQTVKDAYEKVPFYRKAFEKKGIKPEDIQTLDDLQKIPFTVKDDLRDNYPFGMCAVPLEKVVRIHASSGTTGKPIISPYTRSDLVLFEECMARSLVSGGVTPDDVLFNAFGHGLFTGGLGFHFGSERVGAVTVPVGAGFSKRQVTLWQDLGATVLACTPSYALVLAETAQEMGISKRDIDLRVGFFGAEPWSEQMRRDIEERLGLEAYDIFGLTELIGPGVAIECSRHEGLHIMEDHFLPEIIDPQTGELQKPGEKGELVLTSLSREALPLLRYRTRDITILNEEPCSCGRTSLRMGRIMGRSDDMLIIKGVNVFPSQIESVILNEEAVEPHYQIMVDRVKNLDRLEVKVEAREEWYNQGEEIIKKIEQKISRKLRDTLLISANVKVVAPKFIQRSEGKAKRVIDRRRHLA